MKPRNDDKLKALIKLLKTDPVLKKHKVLIFTEFADTARYLKEQLIGSGIEGTVGFVNRCRDERIQGTECECS